MALPVFVFVAVMLLVFGTYWLVVLRPELSEESAVRRRLVRPKVIKAPSGGVVKDVERLSSVPILNNLLAGRTQLIAPIHKLVQQSGVTTTVGVVLLSSTLLAAIGFLLGSSVAGRPWLGLVLAAFGGVPVAYLQFQRARRIRKFEELFPEAIDLLSRSLRAGHAFTTGLAMVADEMPQPLGPEFRLLYDRQNFGLPLADALREFAERVPLLDARFFVTAILTQRESGGNLSEILDNLASVIRDRFTVKRQVRSKSAHGRMTGWILAALPPSLAAIFLIISPDYMQPLLDEPVGTKMVIAGAVLQVVGTLVIRKIVRIEY